MANTMRWRYGDTCPVMLPVDSATVIEIGDMLFLDTDDAKPASAQPDQGTKSSNQQLFHDIFAGVAMQASRSGDTQPIRVATTGVFEFDCVSTTLEVGDMIGPDENVAGTALLNGTTIKVSAATNAVGRCAKRLNPAGTHVLVDIVSSTLKGGASSPLSRNFIQTIQSFTQRRKAAKKNRMQVTFISTVFLTLRLRAFA